MRGTFFGSGRSRMLDLSEVKTYDSRDRINLVTIDNLMTPGVTPHEKYEHPDFDTLISKIVEARKNGRPVIWSMGAHVIKNRLSRYVIELIKEGIITHIASNGAGGRLLWNVGADGRVDERGYQKGRRGGAWLRRGSRQIHRR